MPKIVNVMFLASRLLQFRRLGWVTKFDEHGWQATGIPHTYLRAYIRKQLAFYSQATRVPHSCFVMLNSVHKASREMALELVAYLISCAGHHLTRMGDLVLVGLDNICSYIQSCIF